jgi:hypothetical protein
MPRNTRPPAPHVIDGEDRTLCGSSLYVDLIPKTCWGTAGRTTLGSQNEWVRIRKRAYERAGNACEVCGNTRDLERLGYAPRFHAHERYTYLETGNARVPVIDRREFGVHPPFIPGRRKRSPGNLPQARPVP